VDGAAAEQAIDPVIMQAAAICGAPPASVFGRVLLPLAWRGIGSASLMVFAMALGYFITPALLGGSANMMVAEMIAEYVQTLLQWGLGSAAAFILLAVTLGLYALYVRVFGLTQRI
jgi:putative spermidine/putrescine transport system permease protein